MADQRIKDLNDDYKAVLKTVNEIQREEEKLLQKGKKLSEEQEKQLKAAQKQLDTLTKTIEREKLKQKILKAQDTELASISKSFVKVSESTKKQLKGGKTFLSISAEIAKESARKLRYEDSNTKSGKKQLSNIIQRESILGDIRDDELMQAKATAKAEEDIRGTSFDAQRKELKTLREKGVLTKKQYELGLSSVASTEMMAKKEARLLKIKENQKDLYDSMPESLRSAVSFGQGLVGTFKKAGVAAVGITLLVSILASAVTSFVALDAAADEFNDTTKIAISQMGEMQAQANRIVGEFREIGLEAKDYYNIQTQIVGVLGDSARVSDSIAGAQAVLTKNFGVTNEAAAKTLQIFQSLGGVSENTASSLQLQTMELATQAGVAPAKVLEDIADSSDAIYGAFRGNSEELITQAIQARRLGTNLKDVLETTDKLLDFESSITKELEAAAFVGGQFNLTQARALRAANKNAAAQEEILRQIQRSGDFRDQDVFTQRALAEAAGMTVDEIARQLTVQDKLNSLGADQRALTEEAIKQGLDVSNLNDKQLAQEVQKFKLQKEQQGQVANLTNAFQGIAASLGSAIVPLLEGILPIVTAIATPFRFIGETLKTINENLGLMLTFYGSILAMVIAVNRQKIIGLGTDIKNLFVNRKQLLVEGKSAVASIYKTFASIPYGLGIPLAIASIAGLYAAFSTMSSKANQVGDLMINPNGGPIVSSPTEGGLFQGTRNDALIMAPRENLMGSQNTGGTDKLVRSIERLEKAYMKGTQVNLDGQRVIRGLGRVGNETTQNNFSLV